MQFNSQIFTAMFLTYTWLAVAITALVLYLRQVYSKLSRAGVNHLPVVPFFGNLFWVLMRQEHITDHLRKIVTTFPNDRVVGHYDLMTPLYLVHDVEAVKRITINEFKHFVDRRGFITVNDPLFERGLLLLQGDEWKAMRSTMSPAFTISKIRLMVPFMEEIGKEVINVLKEKIKDSGKPYIDVDTKDLMTRYASDVIASCAFGLKVSSQKEDHEFYTNSKVIAKFTERPLKIFFCKYFTQLAKIMKVSLVPQETRDYFANMMLSTMKDRQKNNIVRHDLINILVKVKRGQHIRDGDEEDNNAGFATSTESDIDKKHHNYEWSDTDLVAQAILFLYAGFDTVSTTMSFLLYELAVNPDVQERLAQEIREHDAETSGKIDYNTLQDMMYLDMVVSEVLRLWPCVTVVDRRCVKDYNFGKPNSQTTKDLVIRKGETVLISPWSFHRDPKFFPEPTKFDPDRFSPENRDKIIPFTYIPFGIGPRNCIGSRFALCEIKVMAYLLLREMEVYPYEQTCFPPELTKDDLNLTLKGGSWVRIRVRPQK
ncbi:hypothetical protein PYW08_016841 [Mythimna loreyi]|uniref:Uncharacterized protein n=1 Tax=Mythimna loreyi TaxID=667449 RepID=A0ACC2QYF4_9NEOP|nr:hypothetical protein PYW08_016841 [Mythimna loreyi]